MTITAVNNFSSDWGPDATTAARSTESTSEAPSRAMARRDEEDEDEDEDERGRSRGKVGERRRLGPVRTTVTIATVRWLRHCRVMVAEASGDKTTRKPTCKPTSQEGGQAGRR